ncbi:MAG: right-handed parallel beta-helix repeat-containing protein, partial [Elusimicrobia bacterium]|nr:right-handed parallel beta-helix repeat-containing protein [Elusimicrobiota bacterium]
MIRSKPPQSPVAGFLFRKGPAALLYTRASLIAAGVAVLLASPPAAAAAATLRVVGTSVISSGTVKVYFSEPVDASADSSSNFSLSPSIAVNSAARQDSNYSARLTLGGALTNNTTFTLTASNIVAVSANTLDSASSTATFAGVNPAPFFTDDFNRLAAGILDNDAIPGSWDSAFSWIDSGNTVALSTWSVRGDHGLESRDASATGTAARLVKRFGAQTQVYLRAYVYLPSSFFSAMANGSQHDLVDVLSTFNSRYVGVIAQKDAGGNPRLIWETFSGDGYKNFTTTVTADAWHSVEMHAPPAVAGSSATFWLDGVLVGRIPANYADAVSWSTVTVGLGYMADATVTHAAYFDEIRTSTVTYIGPIDPPAVRSASVVDANQVKVYFDMAVSTADGRFVDPARYALNPGPAVTAVVSTDSFTGVLLTVAEQVDNRFSTVTVDASLLAPGGTSTATFVQVQPARFFIDDFNRPYDGLDDEDPIIGAWPLAETWLDAGNELRLSTVSFRGGYGLYSHDKTVGVGARLRKTFAAGQSKMYMRLYVYLPSSFFSAMANGDQQDLADIFSASNGRYAGVLGQKTAGGASALLFEVFDSLGVYSNISIPVTADAWHSVELYAPPIGASVNPSFWLDGGLAWSPTVDLSDAGSWNRVAVGLGFSAAGAVTHAAYFDELKISTSNYIGPLTDMPPAGCASARNVSKSTGPYTTIQSAVDDLPKSLSGHACVVIKDGATYAEQVTVQNFTNNGSSITIMADPASGLRPVVTPPAASTAAFRIMNSSVVIAGLDVASLSGSSIPYAIWASSAYVTISSVSVSTMGTTGRGFYTAGIRISSWSVVSYSSVTAWNSHGLWLDGSTMTAVSYSTFSARGSGVYGLLATGASSNTFTVVLASNTLGTAWRFASGSHRNTVSFSSAASRAASSNVVDLLASSSNTITGFYASNTDTWGNGISLDATSGNNTLTGSTVAAQGSLTLSISGSMNVVDGLFGVTAGITNALILSGNSNTVRRSTFSNSSSGSAQACSISGSRNLLSESYCQGNGDGLRVSGTDNRVSSSTLHSNNQSAVVFGGGSGNIVEYARVLAPGSGSGARGVSFESGRGAITRSTVTSGGYGALAVSVSSATILDSYVQGSTAVAVYRSTASYIAGSRLEADGGAGIALHVQGSLDVTATSNTFRAGAQGYSLLLSTGNAGLIVISTNSFLAGPRYGLFIATQTAGAQIWVTSNTIVSSISASADTYGVYLDGLTTGATIQNNAVVWRRSASQAGFTGYGLFARSANNLNIDHNRIGQPDMITAGSFVGAYFAGVTQTAFKFNDVLSTGTGLTNAYLLQLDGSTLTIRNNVFLASMTVTGSSASLTADAASGFDSNYNDWFSSNTANTVVWGGAAYAWPWSGALGKDAGSISAHPQWFDPSAGVEDYHPRSTGGRWNPATQSFAADAAHSPVVDAADPAEPYAAETSPRGPAANMGSYGATAEASRSVSLAPESILLTGLHLSSATVSFVPANGTNQMVELSTAADFTGVVFTSVTANPVPSVLAVSGLSPNTIYHARAGSLVGATTHYAAAGGSPRSSPAKPVSAGSVKAVWSSSFTATWVSRPSSPPDASSESARGYLLETSTAPDFTGTVLSSFTPNMSLSTLTFTGLAYPATYYLRVGTLDWDGRASFTSLGSTQTARASYSGCAASALVSKTGEGLATIQAGVDSLPNPLTGHACVVVLDGATYAEQVTVRNFIVGGSTITIMADPASGLRPVVAPPAGSTAAFLIANASVNVSGIDVKPTAAVQYGVWGSSVHLRISSMNVDSGGRIWQAGVSLSSRSAISYSSVTVQAAHGLWLVGSTMTAVSYSTFQAGSASFYGLLATGASSNTFTVTLASNTPGTAWRFASGSNYNAVSNSTAASSVSVVDALTLAGSSSNTFTGMFVYNAHGSGRGLNWDSTSNNNAVYNSTVSASGTWVVSINGGMNRLDGVFGPRSGNSNGLSLGGSGNTVLRSTFSTTSGGSAGACALSGSGGLISESYCGGVSGNGVYFTGSNNTVSASRLVTSVASEQAVSFAGGTGNAVEDSFLLSPASGGRGARFLGGRGTIARSTITAAGVGVFFDNISTSTLASSYVQASTAVWVSRSTGTTISGSVLVSTNVMGSALWMDTRGSVNLTLSSSTFIGGPQGWGVNISSQNRGALTLSTITVMGARYGVFVGTQAAGTKVWLTSSTVVVPVTAAFDTYGVRLDGLTSGATLQNNAVVWRGAGSQAGFTAHGLFAQSASSLNIDHNRIGNPDMITAGSFVGAYFAGVTQTAFKFNDVLSTGTGLTDAYLLQLAGSTLTIRNNVFLASMTVTGSSASLTADAVSGFDSDYNDWFSSNTANTLVWGGAAYAWPWSAATGKDADSISSHPHWAAPGAGVEDFHPKTGFVNGRYNPATGLFDLTDAVTSRTIDAGDPAEAYALEPAPNGSRANMGSSGNTAQASLGGRPVPVFPGNGAFASTNRPAFTWSGGNASWRLQVASDAGFSVVLVDSTTANSYAVATTDLPHDATYYWRVNGLTGEWSGAFTVVVDTVAAAESSAPSFRSYSSTSGLLGETQAGDLLTPATAQLSVRDLVSGRGGLAGFMPSLLAELQAVGHSGVATELLAAGAVPLSTEGAAGFFWNAGACPSGAAAGDFANWQGAAAATTFYARVDHQWGAASPMPGVNAGNFTTLFAGWVRTGASGLYTFAIDSDDGGFIFVDRRQVLWDNTTHAAGTQRGGSLVLEGDRLVPFVIGAFDCTGDAALRFYWTPPGGANQIVPASQLRPSPASFVSYSTDAGVSWRVIASTAPSDPARYLYTGAAGSTGEQILTVTGLDLARSTNAVACGGAAPCGATNQVRFHSVDGAFNERVLGPFAVLVPVPIAPVLTAVNLSSLTVAYGLIAADGYRVDASTHSDFSSAVHSSVTANNSLLSLSPQGLLPNTTYFLRAGTLAAGTTVYAAVAPASTSTLTNAVSGLQAAAVYIDSVTLNWLPLPTAAQAGSSSTAEGYLLQASSAPDFTGVVYSSFTPAVGQTTLTLSGLVTASTFYFRVGSLNWNSVAHYAGGISTALPDRLFVTAAGAQTALANSTATALYLGGAFVFAQPGGTTTVSGITIGESGTIDAAARIDNVRLRYDLDVTSPYNCASESYAGTEPQYGATDVDGFSGPDGVSSFSGSVALSSAQTMCVYVVADVVGAAAGQTLELSIANAYTDLVVDPGDLSWPPGPVAIPGATTVSGCLPVVSAASGLWSQAATWGGTAPAECSDVTVSAGHSVTVDVTTAAARGVAVLGTLRASRTAASKLVVAAGDVRVAAGGTLDLGRDGDPIPAGVATELALAPAGADYFGLIVEKGADFTAHGSSKTPFALSSVDALAGATALSVYGSTSVAGWQVGDRLIVGKTEDVAIESSEVSTIAAISGGPAYAVTLEGPLRYSHYALAPVPIGNLDRNVVIRSSSTDFTKAAYVRSLAENATSFALAYAELAWLGTDAPGRYGVTFDGAGTRGSISSSTIMENEYGVYLRQASSVTLTGNVIYRSDYFAVYAQNSAGTRYVGNLFADTLGNVPSLKLYSTGDVLLGNYAVGNDCVGVRMQGDGALFDGNRFVANGCVGLRIYGSGHVVSSNTFIHNGWRGLNVNGDRNVVRGNYAFENSNTSIRVHGKDNLVLANDADASWGQGLRVYGDSTTVKDNVVHGLGGGWWGLGVRQGPKSGSHNGTELGMNNIVVGNHVYDIDGTGLTVAGFNALISKNKVHDVGWGSGAGIRVYGTGHTVTANESYDNIGKGFKISDLSTTGGADWRTRSDAGGDSVFLLNAAYGNTKEGFYDVDARGGNLYVANVSYSNTGDGFAFADKLPVLVGNSAYGNASHGLRLSGTQTGTVLSAGDRWGYDLGGAAVANSTWQISLAGSPSLILQGARVSPALAYSTAGFTTDGRFLLSLDQDLTAGRAVLHGDYLLAGATWELRYADRLYRSTATAAVVRRGSGFSAVVKQVYDAAAVDQLITLEFRAGQWHVDGSATGSDLVPPFNGSRVNLDIPSTSPQVRIDFTDAAPYEGDRLSFALLSASADAGTQKRLLFGRSADGYRGGMSRLRVSTGAALVLEGADGWPTVVDRLSASATYYTVISSGAFSAIRSSFTNADSLGLQLAGSGGVFLSSVTFDYLGIAGGTNAYITARDLVSTATGFVNVRFDVSRSTLASPSAYNVRVEGASSGLLWNFHKPAAGEMWGEDYDDEAGQRVYWSNRPPDPLAVTAVHRTSVTASYASVYAQGYELAASTASNFTGVVFSSSVSGAAQLSLGLPGLDPNTTYYLRAGALWFGTTHYSAAAATATYANPVQSALVFGAWKSSITVNWTPLPTAALEGSSNSASGYRLEASTRSDFGGALISSQTLGVQPSTLTVTGLLLGTTYYLRVASLNHALMPNYVFVGSTATAPGVVVGAFGAQVADAAIGETGVYLGGAFTLRALGGNVTVTALAVSEAGSVNAAANLSNLRLRYETSDACQYDGTEAVYGTAAAFAAEAATVAGSLAVGSAQVCFYAEVDVLAGAANGQTLDLRIANPAVDVAAGGADVSPGTAVDLLDLTTLRTGLVQREFRVYRNADALAPGAALAGVNVPAVLDSFDPVRLRVSARAVGAALGAGAESFQLQWATAASGPWTLVGGGGFGDGRDGAVTLSASGNINTAILGSARSGVPDGAVTTVTADPTGAAVSVAASAGFAPGDLALLINLRGAAGDTADVGNYEIHTVYSVPDSATVLLRKPPQKSYRGTAFANQKVVLQRIPQWTTVAIQSGASLTASPWDGAKGGVLVFAAAQTVTVDAGGSISANGLGYRGGVPASVSGGVSGEWADGVVGKGGSGCINFNCAAGAGSAGGGAGTANDGALNTTAARGGGGGGGHDDRGIRNGGGGGAGGGYGGG